MSSTGWNIQYINGYRTKNKMKQINCSNAGDQWHHSKQPPVDFTEKLFDSYKQCGK